MLSFIHLSDIHFHKYSGDAYDADEELRNELIWDIQHRYIEKASETTGILVCGDVAFSGQKQEYKIATDFLNQLCELVQLEKTEVFCVPGNHDIDQAIAKQEVCVKKLQDELEAENGQANYDMRLAEIMRGKASKNVLGLSLENYNESFAGQYSCYMRDLLTWSYDIPLNKKYKLRLFGINSTVISNADDHKAGLETQRPMRIGSVQIPKRADGVIYLTLCHHPPEHWNDPNGYLAQLLDDRAAIQLYGHKHLQKIVDIGTALKIGSGATHPSRSESNWLPRYNWIQLEIVSNGTSESLKVVVYPRIYTSGCFDADRSTTGDKEYKEYYIKIGEKVFEQSDSGATVTVCSAAGDDQKAWHREFAYGFMNLPYLERNRILGKFDLFYEEDIGKSHAELLPAIIRRAEEKGCAKHLCAEVIKR